jgi:hypothetical protein
MAEALVEEEEGDKPGEDGFEGEEERGVGRREMLLGPALNGEGGGGGEEAGDGEREDEARGEVEIEGPSEREGDEHDERGEGDLEGGELGDGDAG